MSKENGTQQKMQPCIITLSESLNTKVFGVDNQVHQKQFKQVTDEINNFIKDAENSGKSSTYERRQNTISIIGSRGSGKSSFLHSILQKYKDDDSNIAVLPIIDPTLIEQKGHIFLVIIAQIKQMVDRKLDEKDCNTESANMSVRKDWRAKLEKLSKGLPTIDGIGHPHEENWEDSDYIMDRGISAVQAAFDLEKNFSEWVKMGLCILEKKAFLLALDDIDLDFPKGWPVLETLRKYITTPHIITLLSGDMELFDKAVRKMQWKNFGKALLKNEGEALGRMKEYDDHVTQLSEQYMLKVMQPAHRYMLDTLWEKFLKKEEIYLRYKTKDSKEATEYYRTLLAEFGIKDEEEAKTYYSYLMNLPLRAQIQLLYALHEKEENNEEGVNEQEKKGISIDAIYSPFLGELNIQKINIHLATSMPTFFNIEVLKFLFHTKLLESSYQLEPSRVEESHNACLTVFSLLFSKLLSNNPFLIFDFFLKIGYISQLTSHLGYGSIEELCKHAAIYQDINLRNAASLMAAYLKDAIGKNQAGDRYYGVINLPGLKETARSKEREGISIENSIDAIFDGKDIEDIQERELLILKKTIGYMPLSIALQRNNETMVQYSFFTLLGVIGELLKLESVEDIEEKLPELSQLRSFSTPTSLIRRERTIMRDSDNLDGDNSVENEGEAPSRYNHTLARRILKWRKSFRDIVIPPYLLGKICTRFFYTLREIERIKFDNLGEAMHRRVIAFFHAVLLEEAKENSMAKDLNYNNPVSNDRIFINNVNKINSANIDWTDNLPFFLWITSCPLLNSFVKKKDTNDEKYLDKYDLYGTLQKVKLIPEEEKINISQPPQQENRNLSVFRGGRRTFIDTITTLINSVPGSYQVVKSRNRGEIESLCRNFFKIPIDGYSIKKLLEYAESKEFENDPIVSAWLKGA